jgi:hypothetical protein
LEHIKKCQSAWRKNWRNPKVKEEEKNFLAGKRDSGSECYLGRI